MASSQKSTRRMSGFLRKGKQNNAEKMECIFCCKMNDSAYEEVQGSFGIKLSKNQFL